MDVAHRQRKDMESSTLALGPRMLLLPWCQGGELEGIPIGCGTQARAAAAEISLVGKMELVLELLLAPAAVAAAGLISPTMS